MTSRALKMLCGTVCGAALASIDLHAQLVVGNDQAGTASIYEINIASGVATPIYTSASSDAKPWGMAYDPHTNTLYWNNGGTLYSSPYGPTLTPTSVAMTFNAATVNFVSLAVRGGRLLGTRNITTEAVYEIDPATGVATQLYVYPSAFDFGGLEADATTDVLYGLNDSGSAGSGNGLYRIDLATQSETFLFSYPGGETDIDGLAVHNGTAYLVTDGPNTAQANFYVYDIASGSQIATIPSPFTGTGTFSAATFIAPTGRLLACDSSRALYQLDPITATRTQIGTISPNAGVAGGLAHDPIHHILYLTSTSLDSLYTVDVATGNATLIGPYGNSAIVMHGLEYDSRNDVLYGLSFHDNGLYIIDRTNGAATLVGTTGLTSFTNLGYDSNNDVMYATNSGTDSFYSIDRATGLATLIGPMNGPANPHGLAFNALQDTLFLIDSSTDELYRINRATGAATSVGTPGSGNYLGLVHLPRGMNITRRQHGCGSTTILASGAAALGESFILQLNGTGLTTIGIGFIGFEIPFCTCVVGHEWSTSFPGGTLITTVPNDPLLVGATVYLQGIDLGAAGACPAPALALTDTLAVTIER